MKIKTGLALMPEIRHVIVTHELSQLAQVDVLEWSFDTFWGKNIPHHCQALLIEFSRNHALYGHGVSFSPLTAERTLQQSKWLDHLKNEIIQFNYQAISEHFGFSNTHQFIQGSPLSLPYSSVLVQIAIKNLMALHDITKVPVGLENLGFAFSKNDIINQGKYLSDILAAVDGFLLLDIHNVYCQMMNFSMSFDEVCESFPLHRVKVMHIAGGGYRPIYFQNTDIYCDSHDEKIPDNVFQLLEYALSKLSNVEAVIFERMGHTLITQDEIDQFKQDYLHVKTIVDKKNKIDEKQACQNQSYQKQVNKSNMKSSKEVNSCSLTYENEHSAADLMQLQEFLLNTFYNHVQFEEIQSILNSCPAEGSIKEWIQDFDLRMIEAAARMTQCWGKRLIR